VSRWCQGGHPTTSCNKNALKYDALQCPRLVEDRLELNQPILKKPRSMSSDSTDFIESIYTKGTTVWYGRISVMDETLNKELMNLL